MTLTETFLSQIADPFRIALIMALIYTMARTRAATGTVIPLAAGVAFVAVLIPAVMQQDSGAPLWQAVGVGLIANAVILGIGLALWTGYRRWRG